MKVLEKPPVPKKTKQATHWAVQVFNDWVSERNSKASSLFQCPDDLLVKPHPPAILDQWLAAFIIEVRKADGNYYTPDSLQCILAGLQRHLRSNLGRSAPNTIDKKNDLFSLKKHALDQQLRFLRANGIGVQKKQAPVITRDTEQKLWDTGTLGLDSPTSLLNAIFFLNGKNSTLRGVSEHFNLSFGSILHKSSPDHIHYIEHGSKNNSGGLEEHNLTVKNVIINAVPSSPRCHVKVYREYLRRVPPEAISSNERFYLQPIEPKPNSEYWFSLRPISENKLKSMLKKIMSSANVEGEYTNHSLRCTGAAEMFTAGVPEALIQKRTGHWSLDSLRLYETHGVEKQINQAISNILAGEGNSFTAEYQPNQKENTPSTVCDNSFLSDEDFIDKYGDELQ